MTLFLCNFITWNDTANNGALPRAHARNAAVILVTGIKHNAIAAHATPSTCVSTAQSIGIYQTSKGKELMQGHTLTNTRGVEH